MQTHRPWSQGHIKQLQKTRSSCIQCH